LLSSCGEETIRRMLDMEKQTRLLHFHKAEPYARRGYPLSVERGPLGRRSNDPPRDVWRVFLSESAVNDFHYTDSREVKIEELENMNKAIAILANTITYRRSPSLARLISLPHTPPKLPIRRNKKEYRRSKGAKPQSRP
jgi:hypothetical protein